MQKTPIALLCDGKIVGTYSLVHVPAIGDDVLLASEVVTKWRVIYRVWKLHETGTVVVDLHVVASH